MSSSLNRRTLLRRATSAGVALALPKWFLESSVAPVYAAEKLPNARPRIALIGCGGMGMYDTTLAVKFGDVVAVCDVDSGRLGEAVKTYPKAQSFSDYRKVCDLKEVDAILNATPDHWHTLVNLRAIASGKDVYAEKPLTMTIDEGKRLVAAVKGSDRILQTGSQQRSNKTFRLAVELVRNGRLGKIHRVRVWIPQGLHGGPFATKPVPQELDWDMWQGQVAATDYVPERCHGTFRYWYDYSGGTMTDWGAHHNDIALWGLNKETTGPVKIEGRAMIAPIPGGYSAPSRYRIRFEYEDGVEHLTHSTSANGWGGGVEGEPKPGEKYHGVQFEGEHGWIYVSRDHVLEASDPELITTPLDSNATRLPPIDDHMANFFDCLETRKQPICHVEIGHRSATVCHLGVAAVKLRRPLKWDPVNQEFIGDAEANGLLAREQRKPYCYEDA
jgi:predicted dehydrogenase